MKDKGNKIGILYFFIHFIIEITSFYVLTTYINSNIIWMLALMYDFYAFVPQGIFGYFKDKGIKVNFALFGVILSSLSLVLLYFNVNAILVILSIAIGNCLIHIEGAETTLRHSNGKMSPSAIFVSGGSFGVITGKILGSNNVSVLIILAINLLMLVLLAICNKIEKSSKDDKSLSKYNYSNKNLNAKVIILLATLVVIVRSFMGYGIPTGWNKSLIQSILLFCFMGTGKALGGILIDHIGIRKTVIVSTLCSLPFLIFGEKLMIVSLIGIMLFSMTMAITLALIVSELKKYPGVAFGFTTLGLFLGSIPFFVFKINNIVINMIIVIVLTILSYILLNIICKKEGK